MSKAGLGNGDGVNTIIYEDPNNEIAGSFSCSTGGLLVPENLPTH